LIEMEDHKFRNLIDTDGMFSVWKLGIFKIETKGSLRGESLRLIGENSGTTFVFLCCLFFLTSLVLAFHKNYSHAKAGVSSHAFFNVYIAYHSGLVFKALLCDGHRALSPSSVNVTSSLAITSLPDNDLAPTELAHISQQIDNPENFRRWAKSEPFLFAPGISNSHESVWRMKFLVSEQFHPLHRLRI